MAGAGLGGSVGRVISVSVRVSRLRWLATQFFFFTLVARGRCELGNQTNNREGDPQSERDLAWSRDRCLLPF